MHTRIRRKFDPISVEIAKQLKLLMFRIFLVCIKWREPGKEMIYQKKYRVTVHVTELSTFIDTTTPHYCICLYFFLSMHAQCMTWCDIAM